MSMMDETFYPLGQAEEEELIKAARSGCGPSLNRLMEAYEGPIKALAARYGGHELSQAEARQVGREALWRAILSDPSGNKPERFWSLGWGLGRVGSAILTAGTQRTWHRRLGGWRLTGLADGPSQPGPERMREASQIEATLCDMLEALPDRPRQVMVAYHGLDGQRPKTYRQIGPQLGYSHTRIWEWHHEALARLSHPSQSYHLRSLLGRQSLREYLIAKRRTDRWLRRRGGR